MTTIDEQRAAWQAYQRMDSADRFAAAGEGYPDPLAAPTPAAQALRDAAGDYGRGATAAICAIPDAADNCMPLPEPPAGSTEGFIAGWRDVMARERLS